MAPPYLLPVSPHPTGAWVLDGRGVDERVSSSFLFTSFGQSSPSCHFTFTQSYHRYLAARVTGRRGHCFPHLHISSPSPLHLQKSLHLHPKLPPVPGVHAARQGPLFSSSSPLHHLHLSTFKSHWALIITTSCSSSAQTAPPGVSRRRSIGQRSGEKRFGPDSRPLHFSYSC